MESSLKEFRSWGIVGVQVVRFAGLGLCKFEFGVYVLGFEVRFDIKTFTVARKQRLWSHEVEKSFILKSLKSTSQHTNLIPSPVNCNREVLETMT